MHRRRAVTTAILAGLFLALYLLFSGSLAGEEVAVGAAAACGNAILVMLLREHFRRPFRVKLAWFVFLWRIPPAMFQESWLLLVALLHRVSGRETAGRFIEHPYPGQQDDEHAAARRAFMTFGVCITPNSYLVLYDRRKRRVLIRQLVGKELSPVDRVFVELP